MQIDVSSLASALRELYRQVLAVLDQLESHLRAPASLPPMHLASDGGIHPFALPLPAPSIPDAFDGGLGYEDILRGDPNQGVLFQIVNWDGYEDGDTAMIFYRSATGDVEVGRFPASERDRFKVVEIAVARRHLANLAFGYHDFFARVRHAGLGGDVDSAITSVRVKLTVPGGLDTDPTNGFINDNMRPPVVEPRLIDPSTPEVTVTLPIDPRWNAPYENPTEGDVIHLQWGVVDNGLTVTIGKEDVGKPVVFTVPGDVIARGGYGSGLVITYEIHDVVNNWSMWSPEAKGVEVTDPNAPTFPWVIPTVGNAGNEIQLAELSKTAPIAQASNFLKGDTVVMRLRGTTADGRPSSWDAAPVDIGADGQPVEVKLPVDFFMPLAQGRCEVYYTRIRGGLPINSVHRRLTVSGENIDLQPPTVLEANGDVIDHAALNGADAHAAIQKHPIIAFGTQVRLEMYGTAADGTLIQHQVTRDIGAVPPDPLILGVSNAKLGLLVGARATFIYTVEVFDVIAGQRRRRRLSPLVTHRSPETSYAISGQSQTLPAPTVPQAKGDWLDPADIDDRIGVQVDIVGAGLVNGDEVTLTWRGTGAGETFTETLIARAPSVTFFVPKAYLTGHLNADVNVSYVVKGKGSSAARVLHVGTGMGELPAPVVREESSGRLLPEMITEGVTIEVPTSVDLRPTDWVFATFGTYKTAEKPGQTGLTFTVPPGELGIYFGTDVEVTYTVIRDSVSKTSAVKSLYVTSFTGSDDHLLPVPSIDQARDGRIDLATFPGNADARCAVWPFIARDQKVWWELHGTDADGSAKIIVLYEAFGVTSNEVLKGLSKAIQRADLEALKDDSTFTMKLWVSFDKSSSKANAIAFPEQVYTLSHIKAATPMPWYFEDFEQLDRDPAAPKRMGGFIFDAGNSNLNRVVTINSGNALTGRAIKIGSVIGYSLIWLDQEARSIRVGTNSKVVTFSGADSKDKYTATAVNGWCSYIDSPWPIYQIELWYDYIVDNITWVPFWPDIPPTTSLDENFSTLAADHYGDKLVTDAWTMSRNAGDFVIMTPAGQMHKALVVNDVPSVAYGKTYLDTFLPRLVARPSSITLMLWSDVVGNTAIHAGYVTDIYGPVRYERVTVKRDATPQSVTIPGAKPGEHLLSLQFSHDGKPNAVYYSDIKVST